MCRGPPPDVTLYCTSLCVRCKFRGIYGQSIQYLYPLAATRFDLQYGPRFVSFLIVVGLTTNYITTGLREKVKWITTSEYDVLPTTRSNDCFKQLCQNRKMDVLEILPRWAKGALHRFVSRSSEVQT